MLRWKSSLKPAAAAPAGYLIDEDFEDATLPAGWTVTGDHFFASGEIYGDNGADHIEFSLPSGTEDELWVKAKLRITGIFSKTGWADMLALLDSGGTSIIDAEFHEGGAREFRINSATTTDSLMPVSGNTTTYLWFHFVKNGTSELWMSLTDSRPTTDSATECAITCSTDNTSAATFRLDLGWSNGVRRLYWDYFQLDSSEIL
jgi:hypothetical protein